MTLGDVLGAIFRARATGTMALRETAGASAGREHRVRFARGCVSSVSGPPGSPTLGDVLRHRGLLSPTGVRTLEAKVRERPRPRVGEILVRERLVASEAVAAALRAQARARLEALFRVSEATVSFRDDADCAQGEAVLPPAEYLRGRPRARDRRARAGATASRTTRVADARTTALRTLGLPVDATDSDVHAAFRRLAGLLHPDRHPDASVAERATISARFASISAAYHTLSR